MGRQCYRVKSYRTQPIPGGIRATVETTVHPAYTNLEKVLRALAPSVTVAMTDASRFAGIYLGNEATFTITGSRALHDEVTSLLDLMQVLISVCDDCDVSHCADLYRTPVETAASPEEWPYTQVGELLFHAKYRRDRSSAAALGEHMAGVIGKHPCLRRAHLVCPMPASSDHSGPDLPVEWANFVSGQLDLRIHTLSRTRQVSTQKGITDSAARKANQARSMTSPIRIDGQAVLLLDDLYMEGETMSEAVRALREAGAAEIFGFCAVKTAKGAYGLPNLLE